MEESVLHLYNAKNAIAVLDQDGTDRTAQYSVLKFELNNIKTYDLRLPLGDYLKLLKQIENDLCSDRSNFLLFHALNALVGCSTPQDEKIPIGSHRKILGFVCSAIKNGEPADLSTYLNIMSSCLSADLYFSLVEMNPETFAQLFKKCIIADADKKRLIMDIYSKLYMDDMITLSGLISLINLNINEILKYLIPMIFTTEDEMQICSLNLMKKLAPAFIKSNYRSHSEWVVLKQDFANKYSTTIKDLLAKDSDLWHQIWILLVHLLSPEIHRSAFVMNKLLFIIEVALKTPTQISNTWDCWKELITIYNNASETGPGIQTLKYIKLLSCPFKRQLKYDTAFDKMFDTWVYLFSNIPKVQFDEHCGMLVKPFLEFSFGVSAGDDEKVKEICPKIYFVFVEMLGHSCESKKCLPETYCIPTSISGYLSSKAVFEKYWKEILQCSGDMIKSLMKLNPIEYKWSDIASCIWCRIIKLINTHFENSELITVVHEELLRILSLLILLSQNNSTLSSICLQSLLKTTTEDLFQNAKPGQSNQKFKLLDLIAMPCMVSCLAYDHLIPIYRSSLSNLLYNEISIKFAMSKMLSTIKKTTGTEPTPDITYDIFVETILEKIETNSIVFNSTENKAQIVMQLLVFLFENRDVKLTSKTVDNTKRLYENFVKIEEQEIVRKFNIEIIRKIYSTNEKFGGNHNTEQEIYLFMIGNNLVLDMLASIVEMVYGTDSISIILKFANQMITSLKTFDKKKDIKQPSKIVENLMLILKTLDADVILKNGQDFQQILQDILEVQKIKEFDTFRADVNKIIEDICQFFISNFVERQNENKNFEKILKLFIPVFQKFDIDDKILADLKRLSSNISSTTPVSTPTRSSFNLNGDTPKSRKRLEEDFIVVPKTPIRKPRYSEKQKEKMKERSADIPSLYNDLSQQHSQDNSLLGSNNIFTPSLSSDSANVSLLELSTSEFEKKMEACLNKSDKLVEIENQNKKEDLIICTNDDMAHNVSNKSKVDDITKKCSTEEQSMSKSTNDTINQNGSTSESIVNLFKSFRKTKFEQSPDLLEDSEDLDQHKIIPSGKQLDFNIKEDMDGNTSKKRCREESDTKVDESVIDAHNTNSPPIKHEDKKSKRDEGAKKNSSKANKYSLRKTATTDLEKKIDANNEDGSNMIPDLVKLNKKELNINGELKNTSKSKKSTNDKKQNKKADSKIADSKSIFLSNDNSSKPETETKNISDNHEVQIKIRNLRKRSESDSSESDSIRANRVKLQHELKRISMDIKDTEKFVNLGNRRSKSQPQKLSLRSKSTKIEKTKKLKTRSNSSKKKKTNKDKDEKTDHLSNVDSDNIDEIESFEEPKTTNEHENSSKISKLEDKIKAWLVDTPKAETGTLKTTISKDNELIKTSEKETETVSEEEKMKRNNKNVDTENENLLSNNTTNLSPNNKNNASPKCKQNDDKVEEELNTTPKQKLQMISTSTPQPAYDDLDKMEDDLDNFRESIEMVVSSQESIMQSTYLNGIHLTTPKTARSTSLTKDDDKKTEIMDAAVAIVIQNTSFEKNNEDTGPQKADENTISDIKSLDYLEVNNLNTSRIVASPEQEDTDERNNELLNNTLDISPIRVDDPTEEIPSAMRDSTSTETNQNINTTNNLLIMNNSPLSSHRSRLITSSANKGLKSRSAHMLGLCNREPPNVDSKLLSPVPKQKEGLFPKCLDSPSSSNLRSARLLKLSDKDLLTFKKEIPSPTASPSASILKRAAKRKCVDDIDSELPPNKSKRVSFNDPIFTTKYLLKEPVSSPQDATTTPCVRKQLIADEEFVTELNNDNMDLFCKPINVEDELGKLSVPDSEEIMGIDKQIEMEKNETATTEIETETQSQVDILVPLEDNVFAESSSKYTETQTQIETQTQVESVDVPELNMSQKGSPELVSAKYNYIFPDLVTCLDPIGDAIDNIFLKTKPKAVERFKKNLYTISDIARLTPLEVNNAPFRSPKMQNIRRALRNYSKKLQESTMDMVVDNCVDETEISKTTDKFPVEEPITVNNNMVNSEDTIHPELSNTQICEDNNEYTKDDQLVKKINDKFKILKNSVSNVPKLVKNSLENSSDGFENLEHKDASQSLLQDNLVDTPEPNASKNNYSSTSDNNFNFDKDALRQFLQKHFDAQPIETYEIVQDVVKEMLKRNYK